MRAACEELTGRRITQRCETCGRTKNPHHFKSASKTQCTQCFEAWIPSGIRYQGEELKTVHGRTPVRLLGIHHNMWLEAESQRRKVIDGTIEVTAYLYKNDNLRIDQKLKVISMCLPSLFSFSAPLIDWPESDLKTLTAIWIRAYKNAWNLGKSTATCLLTFPRGKGGLQVKFPLGTLFTSVWGNLERCSQFDDGTRQMLAISHREALHEHGCLNLLELQDATQYISWKQASKNEVTFACYLANKLDIRVEWDPFNPDLIASSPDATLAALACHVKLPLLIQIEGEMTSVVCSTVESEEAIKVASGVMQYSILIDGQARNPGLPSLRECISRNYGQARWLYELPGMATDAGSDERAAGFRTISVSAQSRGVGLGTNRQGPPHTITSIQTGSAAARNGNFFVGDTVTHADLLPTGGMSHAELQKVMQGQEYTLLSLGISDAKGTEQTISVLRSPSTTPRIGWTQALKPLRDRRQALERSTKDNTKAETTELAVLSQGESAFVKLWPKLRANGFTTFDTIPRSSTTIARTRFSCPILREVNATDAQVLTEWLNSLHRIEGHIAGLELAEARPSSLPSTEVFHESLTRKQRSLALLEGRAVVVAGRLTALSMSATTLGASIKEILNACSRLQRVGEQEGNPLQCYRSADDSASALRTALAVIEHILPGFESNRQQLHWPRLPARTHSSALTQLTAMVTSLHTAVDRLTQAADLRVTRLPTLMRRFYNRCSRDPLQKDAHRSWWETKVALCRTTYKNKKSWPESHEVAIQEVADSWDHPSWPDILSNLRYIRDHPEGPPDRHSRTYQLQQVAWYNHSKAGVTLIRDIVGVRRHLPEGFTRCQPAAHSPSVILNWQSSSTVSQVQWIWRTQPEWPPICGGS